MFFLCVPLFGRSHARSILMGPPFFSLLASFFFYHKGKEKKMQKRGCPTQFSLSVSHPPSGLTGSLFKLGLSSNCANRFSQKPPKRSKRREHSLFPEGCWDVHFV